MAEKKKRRTRGDGGLFRRADGMWIGRVEVPSTDGKRRRLIVSSRDFDTAATELRKLRAKVDDGIIPATGKTTVEKWMTKWLETIHRTEVKPKTYRYYEQNIRLYINPLIGTKRLDKLTPEDVRVMKASLQKKSTRAAQKAHQTLHLALKKAVEEGLLSRNVVEAVPKPKHIPKRQSALSLDVTRHIIRTAITAEESRDEKPALGRYGKPKDPPPRLATRWAAAFMTGARQAELLGLTWDRVNLDDQVIDVQWQLQQLGRAHGCLVDGKPTCGKVRPGWCPQAQWDFEPGFEYVECHRSMVWTRPKSQAGERFITIPPGLIAMLRQHVQPGINPHQLVWHHVDGHPISAREDNKAWTELLKAAKVDHVKGHIARHTTSTMLRSYGVDEQTRMELIGHSSEDAQRIYAHADQARHRLAMAPLDELLAKADAKEPATGDPAPSTARPGRRGTGHASSA